MHITRASSRLTGFTLLEVLVVLVLMSLIAASIVPSLASTSDQAASDRLIAGLIDLDARARILSASHSDCSIRLDETGTRVQLLVGDEDELMIREIQIPDAATVGFEQMPEEIRFDRFGRTSDYGYALQRQDTLVTVRFNGITGWHRVAEGDTR